MDSNFHLDSVAHISLPGNTAMQSSLSIGIDIPRFCYHEKLSIAGNCRMCLLEISYPRSLKPMASCALPIFSGMSIYTNTIMVKKAREGVLELLLINHPLDCPVCDQGGECDLQEQTQKYGGDRGRFYESKRAVEDKECGPIVKTSMNRCIHCTKCVRFCNEICGESVLGTLGRGADMEIGTYIENGIDSELSGNLPDVCPVGALTAKPYAFRARPWELRSFETFDIIDSIGSRIRVDIRGTEILRILPSQSEEINEDWITDRTRFSYDGLRLQRLHAPMVKISGYFVPTTWQAAFSVAGSFLCTFLDAQNLVGGNYMSVYSNGKISIFGVFGDLVDAETLVVLNDFFHELGSDCVISQKMSTVDLDFRSSYLLNLSLDLIEKADLFVFIGLNIRLELPLVNLRVRKSFLYTNALVISFGFLTSLTYQHFQQGQTLNSVFRFLNGKSYVSKCLLTSKFPVIFIGSNCFKNLSYANLFKYFVILRKYSNLFSDYGWHGLSLIDSRISSFASRDLGLQYKGMNPAPVLSLAFLYLCGVEGLDMNSQPNSINFRIFQGHSGDAIAFSADVIFPGSTFVEKEALYVNLEGKIQKTKFLLNAPSLARVDWKIVVAFRAFFLEQICINRKNLASISTNLGQIRTLTHVRNRLARYSPSFKIAEFLNSAPSHVFSNFFSYYHLTYVFRPYFFVYNFIFINNSKNFYLNNAITQISKIMGVCAGRYNTRQTNFLK
jgi:NADH dehydrogenase (ubiquinone) Fe-S protein 1